MALNLIQTTEHYQIISQYIGRDASGIVGKYLFINYSDWHWYGLKDEDCFVGEVTYTMKCYDPSHWFKCSGGLKYPNSQRFSYCKLHYIDGFEHGPRDYYDSDDELIWREYYRRGVKYNPEEGRVALVILLAFGGAIGGLAAVFLTLTGWLPPTVGMVLFFLGELLALVLAYTSIRLDSNFVSFRPCSDLPGHVLCFPISLTALLGFWLGTLKCCRKEPYIRPDLPCGLSWV